jgi:hypothetical protein
VPLVDEVRESDEDMRRIRRNTLIAKADRNRVGKEKLE